MLSLALLAMSLPVAQAQTPPASCIKSVCRGIERAGEQLRDAGSCVVEAVLESVFYLTRTSVAFFSLPGNLGEGDYYPYPPPPSPYAEACKDWIDDGSGTGGVRQAWVLHLGNQFIQDMDKLLPGGSYEVSITAADGSTPTFVVKFSKQ